MPACPQCASADAVKRIVECRPPYMSPYHMLRGKGQGTGLAALAQPKAGVVHVGRWPCTDMKGNRYTHHCDTCNTNFRKPPVKPAPDFKQV